ncbi:MAG: helix-turn-helix domain-containing protein [Ruminococcus sp.]|nr:helix-turn-helix domain-containing protein [Ruminococcus sp.]MBQ7028179.1 helix-turn-helix domain-containing protein [Ruminococcus sp.]
MIKNLSGVYEIVEYENKRSVMLYDNDQTESYPIHWHNAVEIIIPLSNDFCVISGGVEYHLKEKEILIIPPGELHSMPAKEGRRIIFQCDNTLLSDVAVLDSLMPVFNSSLHITPDIDKQLYLIARKGILDIYNDYFSRTPISDTRIYLNLLIMLTAIREFQIKRISNEADEFVINSDDRVKLSRVMKYIDQNFTEEISLDKLAAVAGYSKYHFSRIFKKYHNMSTVQYISRKRIKLAERLLVDPELSITEVAMRSGFSSLTTFNRIFKMEKQCTPTEFKKMHNASAHNI